MVSDEGIEKAMEDIETLKTALTELKDATNEKIGKLDTTLLETRRFMAFHAVEDLRLFLETQLLIDLLPNSSALYQPAHEFLLVESAKARQVIGQSVAPLSIAILFEKNCRNFFTSKHLRSFQD